jgi:hypothetical protein
MICKSQKCMHLNFFLLHIFFFFLNIEIEIKNGFSNNKNIFIFFENQKNLLYNKFFSQAEW